MRTARSIGGGRDGELVRGTPRRSGCARLLHAKDIRINDWVSTRDGLLDTVPITEPGSRAWNYVTLGLGHPGGATFWADFVYNLRAVGYDGTLNIDHEDALVNSVEGVARAADLLKQVALVEPADSAAATRLITRRGA